MARGSALPRAWERATGRRGGLPQPVGRIVVPTLSLEGGAATAGRRPDVPRAGRGGQSMVTVAGLCRINPGFAALQRVVLRRRAKPSTPATGRGTARRGAGAGPRPAASTASAERGSSSFVRGVSARRRIAVRCSPRAPMTGVSVGSERRNGHAAVRALDERLSGEHSTNFDPGSPAGACRWGAWPPPGDQAGVAVCAGVKIETCAASGSIRPNTFWRVRRWTQLPQLSK
jgi:hypothetical protein